MPRITFAPVKAPVIGDCSVGERVGEAAGSLALDPDAVFRYACGYAAQVQVLDACLGALVAALPDGMHLVLVGVRGFPLGEHGQVGGVDTTLPAEQLHVPLLVRSADRAGQLTRTRGLAEHQDLVSTIAAWAGITLTGDGRNLSMLSDARYDGWRDHTVATANPDSHAIRTASWCLRGASDHDQLFVRPDDRFEMNDVAALRPEVVHGLQLALARFRAASEQGAPLCFPPLAEELRVPVD